MNTEIDKIVLACNNIISKRRTPIIPLLLFAASTFSFSTALGMNNENESKMPLLLIAFTLLVICIVKFFLSDKEMIYVPSGEKLNKYELFFEQSDKNRVIELIEKGEIAALKSKAKNSENLPIKVDMFTTVSQSITIVQASQFVPYNYEAITEYKVIKK